MGGTTLAVGAVGGRWELGQLRHSLGAPESSGCSKGLQGLPGVWGSLRGPSCSEDPGGSKGLGLLLRATHELEGCSQESRVFPGVRGVPKSLGCSAGPEMLRGAPTGLRV